MLLKKFLLVAAASAALLSTPASGNQFVFVVDESGSLGGAQQFVADFVPTFDNILVSRGITDRSYGLVGYGSSSVTARSIPVGGGNFGNAMQFQTAAGTLVTNGGTEDGYEAIQFTLDNYNFDSPGRRVIVLVTDEDRDIVDNTLNLGNIQMALNAQRVVLSGIIDQSITDQSGTPAVGATASTAFIDTDNNGVEESSSAPNFAATFDTTNQDYTQLITADPNGFVGDFSIISAGGTDLDAFASALAGGLISIIPVAPVSRDLFVVYGSRDLLLDYSRNFSEQLNARSSYLSVAAPLEQGSGTDGNNTSQLGSLNGFFTVSGSRRDYDYDNTFTDYDATSFAFTAGLDYQLSDNALVGAAIGYGSSQADADGKSDKTELDAFSLALYGAALTDEGLLLSGSIAYSRGDFETKREIGGGTVLDGDGDGHSFSVSGKAAYDFAFDGYTVTPSVAAGLLSLSLEGSEDTMGGSILNELKETYVWANPRVDISGVFETDEAVFQPYAGLGVRFQSNSDDQVSVLTGSTLENFNLPNRDSTQLNVALGLRFNAKNLPVSGEIGYGGDFGDSSRENRLSGRLVVSF